MDIYEDKNRQTDGGAYGTILATVGEEKAKRGQYYTTKLYQHEGELTEKIAEWESLNRLYKCYRDDAGDNEDDPCSFVPIITPIVQGQIASIVEPNTQLNVLGARPGDSAFASMMSAAVEYQHGRDRFKTMLKDATLDGLLFGNAIGYIWWDEEDCDGRGVWRVTVDPLSNVLVDSRIRDTRDIQRAEYIIRKIGFQSVRWARDQYGDELADSLVKLNSDYFFGAEYGEDDKDSFQLIHVWTRNNKQKNLQLIEMDRRGLILRESDPSKPYYSKVKNQYPFAFYRGMKVPFSIYGFGDGRLLEPLQRTVNRLVDEMEIATRFNAQPRTFVDPKGKMDDDQFDNNPSHPILMSNPMQNIRIVDGHGINQVVMTLLSFLLDQAQKATRFSELMMGVSSSVSATATQVGMQSQQGAVGISDKRSDMGEFLEFITKYGLCLAQEFWDKPFWARLGKKEDEFEYIDFSRMNNVPTMVPASYGYQKSWMEQNPNETMDNAPKYETVEYDEDSEDMDEEGNPTYKQGDTATQDVAFDVKVVLGEGLPNSKIAVYNIILSLAQLQAIDEKTGQPAPLLYRAQVQKMIEQMLGFDIGSYESEAQKQSQMMQGMGYQGAMGNMGGVNPASESNVAMPMGSKASMPPPSQDATVPGAGMTGGRVGGF